MGYRYSRWTGSRQYGAIEAEDIVDALAEDVLAGTDTQEALQRLRLEGIDRGEGDRLPGIRDLLERVRAMRRESLARYDLDSMVEDIKSRMADVVATERAAIEELLRTACGSRSEPQVAVATRVVGNKRLQQLDNLSTDPAAAVQELADTEFIDPRAQASFDGLIDMLQRRVMQSHARSLEASMLAAGEAGPAALTEALRALNALIAERQSGAVPDFERFLQRHAQVFPEARTLDDLVLAIRQQAQQTHSLLSSMAPNTRQHLENTMESVIRDPALREELGTLAEGIDALLPDNEHTQYLVSGRDSLTLEDALLLMRRLHDLDELEDQLSGALHDASATVDWERIREVMGDAAGSHARELSEFAVRLEDEGYITSQNGQINLTARSVRRIGSTVLEEIFRCVKRERSGAHTTDVAFRGGSAWDEIKTYEFGDAMLPDVQATIMSAIRRSAGGIPIRVQAADFKVRRSLRDSTSATVLMLDLSRSMPRRGCLTAARKLALALETLIQTRFPRDDLYILGFSDLAREIRPGSLHTLAFGEGLRGTNMHHALSAARRLLHSHRHGTRQILLITDGEPTAHMEGGRIHFAYPPADTTLSETLKEVRRCTRDGIVIDVFMLARSQYLTEFVTRIAQINRGRVFFATPDRLGEYVVLDYISAKTRMANA